MSFSLFELHSCFDFPACVSRTHRHCRLLAFAFCLVGSAAPACLCGTRSPIGAQPCCPHPPLLSLPSGLGCFQSICDTDVLLHYPSHLVVPLSVRCPSLHFTSCLFVLDSLQGTFASLVLVF